MFGYAAFAQPTFAGLGSNQFSVNISEAITYADVQSSLRTTFANISESIISDIDIDAIIATFSASISESLTASDSSNVNANFISAILENFKTGDIPSAIKIHNSFQKEGITINDKLLGAAWIKIDDSQPTNWVIIDNRQ